jgi:hypothetical protein
MHMGDWLTLSGVVVAGVGLGVTAYGIYRGNKNSSASSLIALNDAARQAWHRFIAVKDDDDEAREYEFAELANVLEIACALCLKKVYVGVARELLTEYLDEVMHLLDGSEYAKRRLEALIRSPTTFKYLRRYLKARRKHIA